MNRNFGKRRPRRTTPGGPGPEAGKAKTASADSAAAAVATAQTPEPAARPATARVAEPNPLYPAGTRYHELTFAELKGDEDVLAHIDAADAVLAEIGYTDHGIRHIARVSARAMKIIRDLQLPEREAQLAGIAGFLHDIGNVVHRKGHAQSGALMAFSILQRFRMHPKEIGIVMSAIGNHDEGGEGEPVNNPSAALILADKSDVLRSRVRNNPPMLTRDIHDRVNFAATDSRMEVDRAGRLITLRLTIDTRVSPVMEYFEIFMGRMGMCRRAAIYLNCDFSLVINDTRLL